MGGKQKLGIIGLGKIGGNLAIQAVEKGIEVTGTATSEKPHLSEKGVKVVLDYDMFFSELDKPGIIYLSLPAGPIIDWVLGRIMPYLERGDVVMDGGNSFYLDSIRREKQMWEKGIYYLDCGTSGGINGARHGACFMVGGKEEGVKLAEPILKKLSVPDGFIHTGKPGSGHYVKLVHNGIEFGMLQAIGEGFSLLTGSEFELDLPDIFKNWSNGSVIRNYLLPPASAS